MAQASKIEWMNINGYRVSYDDVNGYIAYNNDNTVVYRIDNNGIAFVRTQDGNSIVFFGMKPSDFVPGKIILDDEGCQHLFSGEAITSTNVYSENGNIFRKITYNDDNRIIREYDETGEKIIYEWINNNDGSFSYKNCDSGIIEHYDPFERLYYIEYPDGSKEYLDGDGVLITIYSDGTYIAGEEKGTYIIDDNGDIICKDNAGNQIFYDKLGHKYQEITHDGDVYEFYKDRQKSIINGKIKYSKIGHIEYDEEAYIKVLNTLNGIDGNNVISGCYSIESAISSFPDSYSSSGINSVKGDIEGHVNLIKSLSEMTNYSLLAYDTCDEELRDGLYLLVDSLFGDNELALANKFKREIRLSIEDRDNDNILEYKENTNFKMLSESVIVASIYTDSDGNKWYLNKNNLVIGLKGENVKLNYGGETFSVAYDENGFIRLTDSKGNPLNIFGDYNEESEQYGGNQNALEYCFIHKPNYYAKEIVENYFPDANIEQLDNIFMEAQRSCCGNVAITNLVFKKFEGNEEGFYDTFGYPMYEMKYDPTKSSLSVDYNYEPMIMDLFCHERKNGTIDDFNSTPLEEIGTKSSNVYSMKRYLQNNYNVSLSDYEEPLEYFGEMGYTLYNMDGTIFSQDGSGHAMIGVGRTADGRIIVSSWGRKYILELSTDEEDIKFGQGEYQKFN